MGLNDWIIAAMTVVAIFLGAQVAAWGNIGVRTYSSWYETHFLVKKKGICRLIYFSPKHFGRYTLYEVIAFFWSFIQILVIGLLVTFVYIGLLTADMLTTCMFCLIALYILGELTVVIVNDIGSRSDNKKTFYMEEGDRQIEKIAEDIDNQQNSKKDKLIEKAMKRRSALVNNEYFTIWNLWDSYRKLIHKYSGDAEQNEKINIMYIEYFRNIENLVVVKEERNGVLILKIKSK